MLNKLPEVRKPTLKVGSTIPLASVLGWTIRRKQLSTSIHPSLSASDRAWDMAGSWKLPHS